MTIDMKKPRRLEPGAKVAVVSPAGPPDSGMLERGVRKLFDLGLEVVYRESPLMNKGYLSDSDVERAAELQAALSDPEIRAVFCSRGGYGSMRMLPLLDAQAIASSPKILVGSSDVTFLLHAYQITTGSVVFHGPMVATRAFVEQKDDAEKIWRAVLFGTDESVVIRHPDMISLRSGSARARVSGGCLSLIIASLGTKYEPDFSGRILFLEDRGEPPYRIDRMLAQLRMAGKLDEVRGIIFGNMGLDSPEEIGPALEFAIKDMDIPVIHGFPAGHGPVNTMIPMGVEVELDAGFPQVIYLERSVS